MNYLPVKTLQEIYLKTVIRNVTHCTSIWGNCATDILSNLDFVHSRAVIIIFNLYLSLSDAKCLSKCNWPSISYFYKKSVLIFKHKVYFDSLFETKLFVGFVPTLIAYLVAQTSCFKGGRLAQFIPASHQMTSDTEILQMVSGQYIEFSTQPSQTHPPPGKRFSGEEQVIITSEISNLLEKADENLFDKRKNG